MTPAGPTLSSLFLEPALQPHGSGAASNVTHSLFSPPGKGPFQFLTLTPMPLQSHIYVAITVNNACGAATG